MASGIPVMIAAFLPILGGPGATVDYCGGLRPDFCGFAGPLSRLNGKRRTTRYLSCLARRLAAR